MTNIIKIQEEINTQLADPKIFKALVDTTFKGLDTGLVKRAIMEGMMRGFVFKDFLEKNIYAIPFSNTYSLVTSIDYARKVGMKSGVCGKSEPIFEEQDGKIISCKITIKRNVDGIIGEYTAKVYFDEYNTGRNLWKTKPRTMLAKIAESHALRMACPEALSQTYVEEEMEREVSLVEDKVSAELRKQVMEAKDLKTLEKVYKENEGLGKEFTKLIVDKKAELIAQNNEKKL